MGIKDLPGAGNKFRITGAGSLPNKLSVAAGFGALSVLNKNNQKAIVDAARKRLLIIRRGGLSELQVTAALSEIKASGEKLTEARAKTIKEVLKHFSRSAAVKEKKPVEAEISAKASDRKGGLADAQSEARKGRNLRYAQLERIHGGSDPLVRGTTSRTYGGGKIISRGVYGAKEGEGMEGIGIDKKRAGKVGFAAEHVEHNNSKLPGNSVSKAPPAGIRPIGL